MIPALRRTAAVVVARDRAREPELTTRRLRRTSRHRRRSSARNFGDDYFLANYKQIAAYWQKLDRQSDRMVVQEIGKTAEGAIAADGDRHVAGEPQEARALQGDLRAARARRRA